jgi:hypothetical protein
MAKKTEVKAGPDMTAAALKAWETRRARAAEAEKAAKKAAKATKVATPKVTVTKKAATVGATATA